MTGVSEKWLRNDVNNKYDGVPRKINVKPKKRAG